MAVQKNHNEREQKRLFRRLIRKITDGYYSFVRRSGKQPISRARLERLSRVYPDELPEYAAVRQDEERLSRAVICLGITVMIAVLMLLLPEEDFPSDNVLQRPGPEERDMLIPLEVHYGGQVIDTDLTVTSREYSEEEKEELLVEAEEIMRRRVLGDNTSPDKISQPLDLSGKCPIDGVEAYWIPREPDIVYSDGTLYETESFGEGRKTVVDLILNFEDKERRTEVELILVAPPDSELPPEEAVEYALSQANAEDLELAEVNLPEEISGIPVTYELQDSSDRIWIVAGLGVMAAVAMFFLPEQRLREAEERRNRELALSYSELVSKLSVLVGAGLTVRMSWERMVSDYRRQKAGGRGKRFLYEEMELTLHSLGQGVLEEQVYSEFGRRCGLAPYLRLGGILESHIKNGTKGFVDLLSAEAADAFRERLQLARRQGEEISARLLLPLLMLFALVIAMLVIPSFIAF